MSIDRRQLSIGMVSTTLGSGLLALPGAAQSPSAIAQFRVPEFSATSKPFAFWPADKPVPEDGYVVPTLEEHARGLSAARAARGAANPYPAEIALGKELVAKDIPMSAATPYRIAERFHKWRKGLVGATAKEKEVFSAYAREWPHRGNPVIMSFFTEATDLRNPRGDTTFWCSAFVCWCIMRSRSKATDASPVWPRKDGAASASYRSWGEATTTPKQGDLAVFQRSDQSWAGHIGFVDRIEGDTIWVLGGNQGAQNDYNGGEVNIAKFSKSGGGSLKLHSFRTSPLLHEPIG